MIDLDKVENVAVLSTGTIGMSWAAFFLARGKQVIASDPDPQAERRTRAYIDQAWPDLERLGLSPGADRRKLRFVPTAPEAVASAHFVQENAPESVPHKMELYRTIETTLGPDCLVASSSSGLLMSALQDGLKHPERFLIGHPFNPPHLIPLVEIVGGRATSPAALEWATRFYTSLGKRTIVVRKEIPGHVANRLQAAVWREAVHLVAEGVVTVAEADDAIRFGPGLRWAVMGPHLTFHLGGGAGGIREFADKLGPLFEHLWDSLGEPRLDAPTRRCLEEGVAQATHGLDTATLARQRDELLINILKVVAEANTGG